MWHVEIYDLENQKFIRVIPDVLDAYQFVRFKEFCLKHGYVAIYEPVSKDEA